MTARPLRIAIDASRTTVARVTGTERYALELIRKLITLNPGHMLDLYFRDTPPEDLFPTSDPVRYHVIPFARAWTHLRFATAIWRSRPDLTFVPAHTLPFLLPGRALVTVHDLGYKLFPAAHPARQRRYLDLTTRYSARRATHILADSQATADDLTRFYGTSSDKISVVYPGVIPPTITETDVRGRYNLPERYFLFIGTLQPRKNIANIVAAYRDYRQQTADPCDLVLAGRQGWLYDERWLDDTEGVHITGYIDEADKGALYGQARALVFPTLYEGFGFPVIEAMHCGLPVITSTTSSLPELAGDAAICVDPQDVGAITTAMIRIDTDDTERERLQQAGFEQAQRFTWEAAARRTLEIMEQITHVG